MSAATPPSEAAAHGMGDEDGSARSGGTEWAMSAAMLAVQTATAAIWATKAAGHAATERSGR